MNELHQWMSKFCRRRRTEPMKLLIDGFSSEFCLVFDFEDAPENPESIGTCDVLIEPLVESHAKGRQEPHDCGLVGVCQQPHPAGYVVVAAVRQEVKAK